MALNLIYCLGSFFQLSSALAINDQDQLLRLWGEVYYLHTHLSTDGRAGFSGLACSLYICTNWPSIVQGFLEWGSLNLFEFIQLFHNSAFIIHNCEISSPAEQFLVLA